MTNTIAVTGASGQLGRSVVSSLLEKGVSPSNIVAVVRTVEKVNDLAEKGVIVRRGDFSDSTLLEQAFQGVSTVLIISGTDFGQRITQHGAVAEAAKKSGATSVVYTSTLHAEKHMVQLTAEHKGSEDAITACGLDYTILRNGWYTENFTTRVQGAVATGALIGSAKAGKVAGASRKDFAEAAAVVLMDPVAHKNKVYELAGDTSVSMDELAKIVSEVSNKEIVYNDMPVDVYANILTEHVGLPGAFASILAESDTLIADGILEGDDKTLSTLIGHPTTTFKTMVEEALSVSE